MLHRKKYVILIITIFTSCLLCCMTNDEYFRSLPPIMQHIMKDEKREFISLLQKDCCTHTHSYGLLEYLLGIDTKNSIVDHIHLLDSIDFFKIIVSSGKLCPDLCSHIKKPFFISSKPPSQKTLQEVIAHLFKKQILLYPWKDSSFIYLAVLISESQEALRKRFKYLFKYCLTALYNNHFLHFLAFGKWICDFCVMKNEIPEYLDFIFRSPACSEIFKSYISKESFKIENLSQLDQTDFEYALITRNTDAIVAQVGILSRYPNNEAAKAILVKLEKALENIRKFGLRMPQRS